MIKLLFILLLLHSSISPDSIKERDTAKGIDFGFLVGQGKILNPAKLENSLNDDNFNRPEYHALYYNLADNDSRRHVELTRLAAPNSATFHSEQYKFFLEFVGSKSFSFGLSLETYNLYVNNYLNYNFIPPLNVTNPENSKNYPYEIFYYGKKDGRIITANIFSAEFGYYPSCLKTKYLSPYIKFYGISRKWSPLENFGASLGTKIHIFDDYSIILEFFYDYNVVNASNVNIATSKDLMKLLYAVEERYLYLNTYGFRIGGSKYFAF